MADDEWVISKSPNAPSSTSDGDWTISKDAKPPAAAKSEDSILDKVGHFAEDVAYPTVGAGLGALAGGVGGLELGPGALGTAAAGAGLGAAAGNELKNSVRTARGRADLVPQGASRVADDASAGVGGMFQEVPAAMKAAYPELQGELPKILSGLRDTRVAKMMNQYLGLNLNDLPKYERVRPGSASEVGSTVYNETGGKFQPTLQKQYDAIDGAIKGKTAATDALVAGAPATAKSDVHNMIVQAGSDLIDELRDKPGTTEAMLDSITPMVDRTMKAASQEMTPAQMLQFRREVGAQIKSFKPTTPSAAERFHQMLYHDLNDEIAGHLNPNDQGAFQSGNRTVNRLIIARDAAGEKLTRGDLKEGHTPVKAILAGAMTGGAAGFAHGGPTHALAGAAIGGGEELLRNQIPAGMRNNLSVGVRNIADGILHSAKEAGKQITPQMAIQTAEAIVKARTNLIPD